MTRNKTALTDIEIGENALTESVARAIRKAMESGCPVARPDTATVMAAVRRWRSAQRRGIDTTNVAEGIQDLGQGLIEALEPNPAGVGSLLRDYEYLAAKIADCLQLPDNTRLFLPVRLVSGYVRRVQQTSSGGDFVVNYQFEAEILSGGNAVEVNLAELFPCSYTVSDQDVQEALCRIDAGMASVLLPKGLGACVLISDLMIHPVDFKPDAYERFARESTRDILGDAG